MFKEDSPSVEPVDRQLLHAANDRGDGAKINGVAACGGVAFALLAEFFPRRVTFEPRARLYFQPTLPMNLPSMPFVRLRPIRPCALFAGALSLFASWVHADPLHADLATYQAIPGLVATVAGESLTVTWDGDHNAELRLKFGIEGGTPTIQELALRAKGGAWRTLATNVRPEFRVVSGLRRITQQQLRPDSIQALGGKVSPEVWELYRKNGEWVDQAVKEGQIKIEDVERWKWDAFWDSPLYVEGSGVRPPSHGTSIPPLHGIFDQPGLPRQPEEITRATASYQATGCTVRTNGARLEITFPGVELGVFAGKLEYDVFKGSNLIHQIVLAKTEKPSVAFKYDGGITGLPITPESRVVWRDLSNRAQNYEFGGPVSGGAVTVWNNNRVIAAELKGGSLAVFPTPHSFYWARESSQNLGYAWYRKDTAATFSLGVRQAENEEDPEFFHNFTLYSARPGTWQRMPVFLYVSPDAAGTALDAALAFTHGDRFKALPGFQVMGSHYHVGFLGRLEKSGSLDTRLNDIDAAKGIGINIYGIIDTNNGRKGQGRLAAQAEYYEAARQHSDRNFLIMPNEELTGGPMALELGGHSDIMISKPIYWIAKRAAGQPLVTTDPKYGKVYNLGTAADMIEMSHLENVVIYEPHPRSKGSTGFPDAIKDKPHFLDENFRGLGWRWGMGIDASEIRLGQIRVLDLWDEMNNWMAARDLPPKFLQAISEARSDIGERGRPSYDDNYGMSPVNYMKIGPLPTVDDMSPIINAMKAGNHFATSGEVLIPNYALTGTGAKRTITADVEWTFPLDFVEVVWGDGKTTDRQIISTADLPAFGKKHFEIPFDATGKKWVRFAAWDIATNGAFVQPTKL